MGMGCGMSMVKYLLFIFNLLCALCGIAILAVGIVYHLQIQDFEKAFEGLNVAAGPILLIIVGSIVFVIAFFGCCGAIRESHCMTITYSIFLMILIVAQIIIGVIIFVFIGDVQDATRLALDQLFANRANHMEFWNLTQQRLECCGNSAITDWLTSLSNTPASCCPNNAQPCVPGIGSFTTPCQDAIKEFIATSGNILGAVILGVAAIELIGFIFACCLANNIRNQTRRYA